MCRQYNDYGSYERDAGERNLNSLHFAELHEGDINEGGKRPNQALIEIAECERACVQQWFTLLSAEIDPAISRKIKAFIDVTDLFGQIYLARDIASREKG